ncbi:MAG: hypothetical protein PHE49_06330 [bacterium]|nr:hypothetical protein [bacterium]
MRKLIGEIISMSVMFFIPALMILGAVFFIFSGKRTRFEIN